MELCLTVISCAILLGFGTYIKWTSTLCTSELLPNFIIIFNFICVLVRFLLWESSFLNCDVTLFRYQQIHHLQKIRLEMYHIWLTLVMLMVMKLQQRFESERHLVPLLHLKNIIRDCTFGHCYYYFYHVFDKIKLKCFTIAYLRFSRCEACFVNVSHVVSWTVHDFAVICYKLILLSLMFWPNNCVNGSVCLVWISDNNTRSCTDKAMNCWPGS